MRDALKVLTDTVKKYDLIFKGDRILVACSGGPDSVFLLFALKILKEKYGFELGCIHINHNLRGKESDLDEKYVEDLSKEWKIDYYSDKIKKEELKSSKLKKDFGLEFAARKIRYEKIYKIAKKNNYNKIALGHTLDEQVETFFLWLTRGKDSGRFACIYPARFYKDILIIRPNIEIIKKELLKFLNRKKISFRIDSSNFEDRYTRNYIRNKIIPVFRELNPIFELKINDLVKKISENNVFNIVKINKNKYNKLRIRLNSNEEYLIKGLNKKIVITFPFINKIKFSLDENKVYFDNTYLNINDKKNNLLLRYYKKGDRIIPFGHFSEKKIKDILIEKKIPINLRNHIPLIEYNGKIIWICGIKRSNFAPINKDTKNILFIEYVDL